MLKKRGTLIYSRDDLLKMRESGQSQTDLDYVRSMSESDIATAIASDPDAEAILPEWLERADAVAPMAKRLLSLRIDSEVVDWFKERGPGYQSRMNAVLRTFMDITKRAQSRGSIQNGSSREDRNRKADG